MKPINGVDFSSLIQGCREVLSDDDEFLTFKRNKNITKYFEHLTEPSGRKYYDYIKNHYPELINLYVFDLIGYPKKCLFDDVPWSPTTLRYLKVYGDLNKYFSNRKIESYCEIGAGYAGQYCLIEQVGINLREHLINRNAEVIFIDLPDVLKLQSKYIEKTFFYNEQIIDKKFNFITPDKVENKDYDFVISNYAISECESDVINTYLNKIIYNSKRGYLTLNTLNNFNSLVFYNKIKFKHKDVLILDEEPNTGYGNKIVIWGYNK